MKMLSHIISIADVNYITFAVLEELPDSPMSKETLHVNQYIGYQHTCLRDQVTASLKFLRSDCS